MLGRHGCGVCVLGVIAHIAQGRCTIWTVILVGALLTTETRHAATMNDRTTSDPALAHS